MVAAWVLLSLVLLRLLLLALGTAFLVRTVRACPACFNPTTPVLVRWLRKVSRFELRWCMHCGWRGISRARTGGT